MIRKITRKNLEKFLAKYATSEKVLDLGSGGSSYDRFFPNRVTVDIDPDRKPDIVADARSLPFKDGEFDFVLCTEMLEHVKNPFEVESEIRRVTVIGGTLVLTTRFLFPLHDTPHDYWRFTKYGLRNLFKEWEIIELVDETESFSAIAAILQRLQFQTILKANKVSKLIILVFIVVFDRINWLIKKEYGDIKRNKIETNIMSTGYYIVCKKR
ncbi:class I SAM-dependent methyltransferase [Candidatus Parcubacteria bacterium]|nr:class I SAM-dependent methyltransferase [Candidatus Parcubacteria bacterium]